MSLHPTWIEELPATLLDASGGPSWCGRFLGTCPRPRSYRRLTGREMCALWQVGEGGRPHWTRDRGACLRVRPAIVRLRGQLQRRLAVSGARREL